MDQNQARAALMISPREVHIQRNEKIGVTISIGANDQPLAATDAWLLYDPNYLKPVEPFIQKSVFPASNIKIISPGRLYIATYTHDVSHTDIIGGTIATIEFQTLKNGSTSIGFDCSANSKFTSQIIASDASGTNLIDCNSTRSYKTDVIVASNSSTSQVLGVSDLSQSGSQFSLVISSLIIFTLIAVCVWYFKKYSVMSSD